MKIETLSKEQIARFPEFVKKWTDIGLSTERANRKEAEEGVKKMYQIAGLKEPKIVWCDSPLSQGLTRRIVQKLESDGKLNKGTVGKATEKTVGNSVWDSVRASVGDSVWDSVRNSVWDSVRDSVGDSGYGQHDANWLAFYDFFKEVNGLNEETSKLEGINQVSKNAGWYLPHENICWISERPISLSRNTQGSLHSTTDMAIKYPDGWGIYALNGVRFPEELWTKVVNKKLSWKEIQGIDDIDQRTQAMAFADINDFIKLGEIVDTFSKETLEGEKVNYSLLKIPQGVFTIDAYFAIYDCPSTGKKYSSGIDPKVGKKHDVKEAMSWKHKITVEDFMNMIPLLHES